MFNQALPEHDHVCWVGCWSAVIYTLIHMCSMELGSWGDAFWIVSYISYEIQSEFTTPNPSESS